MGAAYVSARAGAEVDRRGDDAGELVSDVHGLAGVAVGRWELPVSVQGQVQRSIDEATMLENLCQMFMGWQAWL